MGRRAARALLLTKGMTVSVPRLLLRVALLLLALAGGLAPLREAMLLIGNYPVFIQSVQAPPELRAKEWVATFAADTAVLPEGAETFDADVAFEFPGRNQSRTAVQGIVTLSADAVEAREPREDLRYRDSVSVVLDVEVPEDDALDRVELFLDDRPVATLYQEPFVQPLLLESDELAYLRAVA